MGVDRTDYLFAGVRIIKLPGVPNRARIFVLNHDDLYDNSVFQEELMAGYTHSFRPAVDLLLTDKSITEHPEIPSLDGFDYINGENQLFIGKSLDDTMESDARGCGASLKTVRVIPNNDIVLQYLDICDKLSSKLTWLYDIGNKFIVEYGVFVHTEWS